MHIYIRGAEKEAYIDTCSYPGHTKKQIIKWILVCSAYPAADAVFQYYGNLMNKKQTLFFSF